VVKSTSIRTEIRSGTSLYPTNNKGNTYITVYVARLALQTVYWLLLHNFIQNTSREENMFDNFGEWQWQGLMDPEKQKREVIRMGFFRIKIVTIGSSLWIQW
jgi:gamma-glutamylcyclotransferase (GGCT)/AIG2-like uncharacterized protein YtfP